MNHAESAGSVPTGDAAMRFNALWTAHAGQVLAYARRHLDWAGAQEVVSEMFLVAWRRLERVPADPLPWLLVVARNTVHNQKRSSHRRRALQFELERLERLAVPTPGADLTASDRADVLAALASLTTQEREAILLVAWDGLKPADAARVADCSTSTFHVRLHRARKRLREAAANPSADTSPDFDEAPATTQQKRKVTT